MHLKKLSGDVPDGCKRGQRCSLCDKSYITVAFLKRNYRSKMHLKTVAKQGRHGAALKLKVSGTADTQQVFLFHQHEHTASTARKELADALDGELKGPGIVPTKLQVIKQLGMMS
jgi:hypothetical protein